MSKKIVKAKKKIVKVKPAAFENTNGPLRLQTGRWGQVKACVRD